MIPLEYENYTHQVEEELKQMSPAQRQEFFAALREIYCQYCGMEHPQYGKCDCTANR